MKHWGAEVPGTIAPVTRHVSLIDNGGLQNRGDRYKKRAPHEPWIIPIIKKTNPVITTEIALKLKIIYRSAD